MLLQKRDIRYILYRECAMCIGSIRLQIACFIDLGVYYSDRATTDQANPLNLLLTALQQK